MSEILLTPAGHLRWEAVDAALEEEGRLASLRETFHADWREGLFSLAAKKLDPGGSLTLRYWQGVAEQFLTRLCQLPEEMTPQQAAPPGEAECAQWVLTAPPMQGGEYLTAETLLVIWNALAQWCGEAASQAGSLGDFLQTHAPRWHQVGRVCFHLAENKADPDRPFAFMATYVSGLGAAGRARHLPLRQALEQYAGANNLVRLDVSRAAV